MEKTRVAATRAAEYLSMSRRGLAEPAHGTSSVRPGRARPGHGGTGDLADARPASSAVHGLLLLQGTGMNTALATMGTSGISPGARPTIIEALEDEDLLGCLEMSGDSWSDRKSVV